MFFDVTSVTINSMGERILGQMNDNMNHPGGLRTLRTVSTLTVKSILLLKDIDSKIHYYFTDSKIHTVSDYRLFFLIEFLLQTEHVNRRI